MTQLVWISVLDSRVTWPNDSRLSGFEQQKCMFLLFWRLEYRTQSPARAVPTGSLREVVSQYFSWLPKFVNHPWGSLVYSLITHLCLLCKSSEVSCSSAWYSPAEPRDTCPLICLILASWAARHLPAHLPDTRQLSLATPARSSDW